jgi:hypothetical protein
VYCNPAPGDLAFNIALGATLVALPLSIGAAARAAFVKYKFTDKRVSVKTDAPWESEYPWVVVSCRAVCFADTQCGSQVAKTACQAQPVVAQDACACSPCTFTDRVLCGLIIMIAFCYLRRAEKQTDCAYQEVKDVRVVSRGLGAWGDMVIELKNGDKLELRSLEK